MKDIGNLGEKLKIIFISSALPPIFGSQFFSGPLSTIMTGKNRNWRTFRDYPLTRLVQVYL